MTPGTITALVSLLKTLKVPAVILSTLLSAGVLFWSGMAYQRGLTASATKTAQVRNAEASTAVVADHATDAVARAKAEGAADARIEDNHDADADAPAPDIYQSFFDSLR